MARGRRLGRGLGPGQRHGMDRRETCEIPPTSTWETAGSGSPAEQPTLAWAAPSGGSGALRRDTKRGRTAWTPEAKPISDRGCAGGKSERHYRTGQVGETMSAGAVTGKVRGE